MAGVEVSGQGQIVALPFRVEKLRCTYSPAKTSPNTLCSSCSSVKSIFSFDAKWTSEQGAQLDLDLTCCTFSKPHKASDAWDFGQCSTCKPHAMAQVPRESYAALLAQVTAQQRKVEYFTRSAPMLAWQSAWTTQYHTVNYVSCCPDLHVQPLAKHKHVPTGHSRGRYCHSIPFQD